MEGRQYQHWQVIVLYFVRDIDESDQVGSISTADGSALVRMGDTTMVCGIKAEITEPDSARPTEGILSELTYIATILLVD